MPHIDLPGSEHQDRSSTAGMHMSCGLRALTKPPPGPSYTISNWPVSLSPSVQCLPRRILLVAQAVLVSSAMTVLDRILVQL